MLTLLLAMVMTQKPIGPLPTKNQLDWHKRQYYAFVHFGPNTFTGNEWGKGTEDPNIFNPTELDCRQWCRVFKAAGMSGVIITAKHHDGFVLWQSKLTKHGVMSSKWRDGKGDVLKDLSAACREYGLWMGVYLSPWDINHPTYGTPAYNDTFVGMLKEVLTNYGDIKEVWFDGANGEGPNGKKQVYDWPRFEATVHKYAPNAVIFGDAGDVRWVGNESGFVGETNWNFMPAGHWPGDQSIYQFLNTGDPNGDKYSPGECDVSIRPGWFWRASENSKVKTLDQLKDIYYGSIGHGGNMLLNVPANEEGLISQEDIDSLMKFRRWRDETFTDDLALTARATATSGLTNGHGTYKGFPANHKYWSATDNKKQAAFALNWMSPQTFDHVVLGEYLTLGQRIAKFSIECNGTTVAEGTTVGYKRVLRFPTVTTNKMRVVIESSRAAPTLAKVSVYLGLPGVAISGGSASFIGEQKIVLSSDNHEAHIHYTLDGSTPTASSVLYRGPITIDKTTTVKAIAVYQGRKSFEPAVQTFTHYSRSDLWHSIVFVRQPDPGIAYTYIEQGWQTLDQMKNAKTTATGVSTKGLDIGQRKRDEHFGFSFNGVFTAQKDGIYTFFLTSDDGSRLYIDGKRVIDNDGLHGMETKDGVAPLQQGYHQIRVEYFNATGGMGLKLEMQGPGIDRHEMTSEEFRH
ncbi:MAG TPA: alpha-L-fucosidase [Fimbriimonadaceae bacterium]|nr:alpha-L-fucosidase [Fimbriimonadaceae bacterium]